MERERAWFARVAVAALVGCAPVGGDGHTRGEFGQVHFSYKRSCFFGCPIDQPLLSGTREAIELSGRGNDEGIAAKSSDKDVAVFAVERACYCERKDDSNVRVDIAKDAHCEGVFLKTCENTVLVEAKAAGDAKLTLTAEDGSTVDRVTVQVRNADQSLFVATFADRLGSMEANKLDLSEGDTVELKIELFDADGRKLLAPEAVTWRVDDDTIAAVSAFLVGPSGEIQTGLSASVHALAAGEAELTVDVPGNDGTLALHVR